MPNRKEAKGLTSQRADILFIPVSSGLFCRFRYSDLLPQLIYCRSISLSLSLFVLIQLGVVEMTNHWWFRRSSFRKLRQRHCALGSEWLWMHVNKWHKILCAFLLKRIERRDFSRTIPVPRTLSGKVQGGDCFWLFLYHELHYAITKMLP